MGVKDSQFEEFDVEAVDLYVIGVGKIGELRECTVAFKTGGERIPVSSGVIKTKGKIVADVDFEAVVPADGMSVDVFMATITQANVYIDAPFNGSHYIIGGTFDDATMKSVQASGLTTGSFKFSGGLNQVIGA